MQATLEWSLLVETSLNLLVWVTLDLPVLLSLDSQCGAGHPQLWVTLENGSLRAGLTNLLYLRQFLQALLAVMNTVTGEHCGEVS